MTKSLYGEPATYGFFSQPGLFVRGYGGGRSIDLDIIGPDLNTITAVIVFKSGPMISKSIDLPPP